MLPQRSVEVLEKRDQLSSSITSVTQPRPNLHLIPCKSLFLNRLNQEDNEIFKLNEMIKLEINFSDPSPVSLNPALTFT